MAYLTSDRAQPPPRLENGGLGPDAPSTGRLAAPFANGSVLLVPESHHDASGTLRVVWKADSPERAVAVPAGRYRMKHYAIETEHDGETWILSGSGMQGKVVEIHAGAETKLEIDGRVHVDPKARPGKRKLAVNMGIRGDGGMGLSVIRGKERIPIRWSLQDASGREFASGTMKYG